MKSAIFYWLLFGEVGPENSREISPFFREFGPKNPAKFDFFSSTYQKPSVDIVIIPVCHILS